VSSKKGRKYYRRSHRVWFFINGGTYFKSHCKRSRTFFGNVFKRVWPASEIVYSCLMMQNNFIAPNINFENPDEDSAKLNIVKTSKHADINVFLSNSFGFGGTNSSLIVRKW